MPQFFINNENIHEDKIIITNKSDINHITNVLRNRKKDKLILSGVENIVYEAEIVLIKPELIEAKITDKYHSDKKLKINITLAQSIIKSNKQDFLVQKTTELGVRTIIPFISKNTVVRFDSEKDKLQKIQRWQKIVYESAKQCQRGDLTDIKQISTFNEIINLENFDLKIVCSEKENSLSIRQVLQACNEDCHCERPTREPAFLIEYQKRRGTRQSKTISNENVWIASSNSSSSPRNDIRNILLVIGPEGGWEDSEIEKLKQKGFASVTLGKLVYRAETAAVAAISHIIYEYEL